MEKQGDLYKIIVTVALASYIPQWQLYVTDLFLPKFYSQIQELHVV